jgi:hypothetical protein
MRCGAQLLFSVKSAVCCYVHEISQLYIVVVSLIEEEANRSIEKNRRPVTNRCLLYHI